MADNQESPADGAAVADEVGEAEIGGNDEIDALLSRLRVIEDQPLENRATAFVQVHDELRRALEGADAPAARD